nr:plexin a4 [Hymenolepis microstoma]
MLGILCAFIYLLLSSLFSPTSCIYVENEYRFLPRSQLQYQTEPPKVLFRRFKITGEAYLFVAHVNKISQLNPDNFSLLTQRAIGPKNCSIFCYFPGDHCIPVNQLPNRPLPQGYRHDYLGPRLTNAFVKSWATSNFEPISPEEDVSIWRESEPANNDFFSVEDILYVCYNVFHGFCERLQLTNISNSIPWTRKSSPMDFYPKRSSDIPIPVVNWNASLASTLTVDASFIFVGLEQDEFQDTTLVVLDPISLRMRDFDYASREPSDKSSLRFREIELDVKYKFSFQYTLEDSPSDSKHLYVYFVAQQPNKTLPGILETRLIRFCSTLHFFHSYVDLQLICNGCVPSGREGAQKRFGAFHMAVRGTVGSTLAAKRHAELVKFRHIPAWRRPINLSEDFNNVLLVAFAPQLLDFHTYTFESRKPIARGTAIAFYTMAEIDVYFGIVIYNCLMGRTSTGPSYLSGYSKKCDRDDFLLPTLKQNSYCPSDPMNYPISGSLPSERLSAQPVLMLDVDVTGMAITRIAEEFTVLIITTDEGEFARYEVEDNGKARLIASKQLTSRRRPLRGVTLDDTGHVAFAISDEKVYRVALFNCSSTESCGACLAQRDPFCGWCITEGICTHKTACSSSHWLSYRASPSSCPQLTSINPPSADISQSAARLSRTVITFRLIPPLLEALSNAIGWGVHSSSSHSRHVLCTFRRGNSSTDVEPPWRIREKLYAHSEASLLFGSTNASCSLPSNSDLQVLDAEEEYTYIDIWLEVSEPLPSDSIFHPLASGKFLIYDCGKFTTCESCLGPQFNCVWHLIEGRCLSLASSSTSSGLSPFANSKSLAFCAKSNCTCPSFEAEERFITVEANHPVSVVLTLSNVKALANRFSCSESCTDRWTEGIYNSATSTVICAFSGIALKGASNSVESTKYASGWHPNLTDLTGGGLMRCEISINWHNDRLTDQPKLGHHLVNSQNSLLEVYNCSLMAVHCDSCLALPRRFSCAWCSIVAGGSAGCFKIELCAEPGPLQSCPYPQLLQVIPENATLEGQTQLTLRGVNLGSDTRNMAISSVLLDYNFPPISCTVLSTDFLPSRQVTCRLESKYSIFEKPSKLAARIVLQLMNNNQVLNASLPFTFLNPAVKDMSPNRGPASGGTILKFHGQYLNAGTLVEVYISDAKCEILSLSSDLLTCKTPAVDKSLLPHIAESERGVECKISLRFDESREHSIPLTFFFTHDPEIRTVTKTLIFLSGGTTIRVFGQYFDVIEHPQIVFYHDGMEYIESCQPTLGYLSCLSPSLDLAARRKRNLREFESGTTIRPITNPLVISKLLTYEHDDEMMIKSTDKTGKALIITYGFIMDNVTDLLVFGVFPVYPNPEIFPFTNGRLVEAFSPSSLTELPKKSSSTVVEQPAFLNSTSGENSPSLQNRHLLRFHGNFGALAEVSDSHALDELSINVVIQGGENGTIRTCKPTIVKPDEIRCELNRKALVEGVEYPVFIQFGKYLISQPGVLQFKRVAPLGVRDRAVIVACSVIGVLALLACLFLTMWFHSRKTERDLEKRFKNQWIEQEKCVARAFKNDFIELQTHVDELVQDLNKGSLPIRDYQTYCLFSLFPEYHLSLVRPVNPHDMLPYFPKQSIDVLKNSTIKGSTFLQPHPLISSFKVSANVQESADRGIYLFNRLLHDRRFLCLLVDAIESNCNIDARAKSQIASLLSIIFHPNMEYFTQIILSLITDLLRNSRDHGGDSRLLTAFRRAESVVAKMLSNWLTFLLYNFIREHAAEHLFILYRALKQQINTGPQDAVTGLARYTLDAATLLKSDLLSRQITLLVVDPEDLFGQLCPAELQVRVLLCDTVTQVKEKILDTIYRNTPYKNQIRPTDVYLRKIVKTFGDGRESIDLLMMDWDLEVRRDTPNAGLDGPPYRLNCLSDYKMNDGDVLALVRARSPSNGSGTLPGALIIRPGVDSWDVHSCPPSTGSSFPLPLHHHPTSMPLSNRPYEQVGLNTLNIRPTGGPSPQLWYHLERPTSADPQVQIERGGRTWDADHDGKPPLCCGRLTNSREKSHRSPSVLLSSLTSTQQQQFGDGLDARSLRRWLAAGSDCNSTTERVQVSQGPSLRNGGVRRTRHAKRRLFREFGSASTPETVELAISWAEEQDDAIDRPMTKLPCEIFLNRLLRTRVSVAKYMDRVFELIFGAVIGSQSPPLCIKFLFDFLDFQAESLGIHDPGVLHAWKANCLHLRFWNQILINLDYVFDIPLLRNTALERSFHSFSQAITYACSPVLDKVTMDSPINKALFSSDIERHWLTVKNYFAEIKAMPPISLRDMNFSLAQHSKNHKNDFNVSWALYELYTRHVKLCYDTLVSELETMIETGTMPIANISHNAMGDSDNYSHSDGTGSLQGGGASLSQSQNVNWDPLSLLQSLKEVNSCMTTVAASNTMHNNNEKASILKSSNSATNSPLFGNHSRHQPTNGNRTGRGGCSGISVATLRSVVPHSERRLPPLPSLP